jgi:hypothetical protein
MRLCGSQSDWSCKVGQQSPVTLLRFDADAIIYGVAEPLLAAEIPLSGLDTHVAEQKLNLFQLDSDMSVASQADLTNVTL